MQKTGFALGWVREKIIGQLKGMTSDMLQKDCQQGIWIEGVHYRFDSRRRKWWNYEAMDEHIANGLEPKHEN